MLWYKYVAVLLWEDIGGKLEGNDIEAKGFIIIEPEQRSSQGFSVFPHWLMTLVMKRLKGCDCISMFIQGF